MIFGAAIGSLINNVPLAIILAFLGHYFLDLFPHVEYLESVESSVKMLRQKTSQNEIKDMAMVGIDFCAGLLVIFLTSNNSLIVYWCALVAIIPDGLTVIHIVFPKILPSSHHAFHASIQYFTKRKQPPMVWRVATQAAAVVASIILLKI